MPKDEREAKQVSKVHDLLVKTHSDYHNFRVDGDWGYAQKRIDTKDLSDRKVVVEKVIEREKYGLGAMVSNVWNNLKK